MRAGDCIVVVGTSGVVYPAANLPTMAMQTRGVISIEINPEESTFTPKATFFLKVSSFESSFFSCGLTLMLYCKGPSGRVLPELVELVEKQLGIDLSEQTEDITADEREQTNQEKERNHDLEKS